MRDLDAARKKFLALVDPQPDGCWLWTGSTDDDGYGRVWFDGRSDRAHRVSYRLFIGEIPAGMAVLHTCDNPPCVRPDHLWAGTQLENIADRERKGRGPRGERNGRAKLNRALVQMVREARAGGMMYHEIGALFGIHKSTVHDICTGKLWPEPATMPVMELIHATSDSTR